MGSSPFSSLLASPEFLEVFHAHADGRGRVTFAKFMELALYHQAVGYYRQPRPRVGYAPGTDFFTASTSGAVFGELVVTSCATLLRAGGRDPAACKFVEIGSEPNSAGVLSGVAHPFNGATTVRVGESLALEGECVVFSNELFDAQPFVRSVFHGGAWRELGVELRGGRFAEVVLDTLTAFQPAARSEGYQFDQPVAAAELANRIAAQPWRGLFVAFDYGKTLRELTDETPGGTARAYFKHTQTNDLLARPGKQDLTCHICWDWISDALKRHRFAEPALSFQESFFIRNAGEFIAGVSADDASQLSSRKLALLQLLHPSHLGQKFQVLHALR